LELLVTGYVKSQMILKGNPMNITMSKGSNPRPVQVPRDQYRDNWDQIFGRKQPEPKPNDK
jgi:hypothetical protein